MPVVSFPLFSLSHSLLPFTLFLYFLFSQQSRMLVSYHDIILVASHTMQLSLLSLLCAFSQNIASALMNLSAPRIDDIALSLSLSPKGSTRSSSARVHALCRCCRCSALTNFENVFANNHLTDPLLCPGCRPLTETIFLLLDPSLVWLFVIPVHVRLVLCDHTHVDVASRAQVIENT